MMKTSDWILVRTGEDKDKQYTKSEKESKDPNTNLKNTGMKSYQCKVFDENRDL